MRKRRKKRWAEMTGPQRVMTILGTAVQMALFAAAMSDIRRRPAEQIRGSKRVWRAAAFVNYAGPIAYFLFGRRRPVPAE